MISIFLEDLGGNSEKLEINEDKLLEDLYNEIDLDSSNGLKSNFITLIHESKKLYDKKILLKDLLINDKKILYLQYIKLSDYEISLLTQRITSLCKDQMKINKNFCIKVFLYLSSLSKYDAEGFRNLQHHISIYTDIINYYNDDDEVIFWVIKIDPYIFNLASKRLKSDKIFVINAFHNKIYLFMDHIDSSLYLDQDIIIELLLHGQFGFQKKMLFSDIPETLQNDLLFIQKLLQKDGRFFEYLNQDFRSIKSIQLIAIKNYPRVIKFCLPYPCDDEEIVSIVVKNYGFGLKYASSRLQNNKEIVQSAINNDGCAIQFLEESNELRYDIPLVKVALFNSPESFWKIPVNLKNNPEIFKLMLKRNPYIFEYMDYWKDNPKLVKLYNDLYK
jgi:hypothetical protein